MAVARLLGVTGLFPVDCLATDAVGDCVYIRGDKVADRYQVGKADVTTFAKMPAVGVLVQKISATQGVVQWLGELRGLVSGFNPKLVVFVARNGTLTQTAPTPTTGEIIYTQVMGSGLSSVDVLLSIDFLMVKQRG